MQRTKMGVLHGAEVKMIRYTTTDLSLCFLESVLVVPLKRERKWGEKLDHVSRTKTENNLLLLSLHITFASC